MLAKSGWLMTTVSKSHEIGFTGMVPQRKCCLRGLRASLCLPFMIHPIIHPFIQSCLSSTMTEVWISLTPSSRPVPGMSLVHCAPLRLFHRFMIINEVGRCIKCWNATMRFTGCWLARLGSSWTGLAWSVPDNQWT